MLITYLGDPWFRSLEQYGVALANSTVARLRASGVTERRPVRPPEGPQFRYEAGPDLFLGRKGLGPLHIAWDTNLLIDYFDHGRALWKGESLTFHPPTEQDEQVEALEIIIGLWVLRDIRFHILPLVIEDAKKVLSHERRLRRCAAWKEFCAAMSLVSVEGEWSGQTLILPDSLLERALMSVPEGYDRMLVRDSVKRRLHVFLTRDKEILSSKGALKPFGLLVTSPQDLLEDLSASGSLHCLLAPQYLYWPLPDQQRVAHLVRALGDR